MKILAVSDRVLDHLYSTGVRRTYSDVDLIVGCGDLPYYYLDFLISALDVPLVYVRGNHDAGPQYTVEGRTLTSVPGGIDVHRRIVEVKGILIAGLEGSMRYRPGAPLMYTENEMRWEALHLVPGFLWNRLWHGRALDVLVTHSPPFGVHDRPDRAHRGFQVFHRIIRHFRPRYLLHGHVHVYRQNMPRVTRVLETTVVNVYPYRCLTYEDPTATDAPKTQA
jgi:Icc-related predicted phosphoesterase